MDKEHQLLRIAEAQQGYFTSRQAEGCGLSRTNFHRRLASGVWLKTEVRGVYRLALYPQTSRPELTLWSLWSAGRDGVPQGTWSHETALEIHELSDVSPSKLHLTVPKGFRKGTPIPSNLALHYVESLPSADVELRQGYQVTKPLRTLTDVIKAGSIQPEQLESAILDLCLKRSLETGLVTLREMDGLAKVAPSLFLKQIIERAMSVVWKDATQQLTNYGRLVEPYTVGLSLEGGGYGMAVLCQYESRHYLLTATHVARALRRSKTVSMVLRFDHHSRAYPRYSTKDFAILEWAPGFSEGALDDVLKEKPKDLSLIMPSSAILDVLRGYKVFYPISKEASGIFLKDAFVTLGGEEDCGPFGLVASEYSQWNEVDYLTCPVPSETYETRNLGRSVIKSFRGLSGGGLWKCANDNPSLVGIAIAQDLSGERLIYFHGPQSIQSLFSNINLRLDND